MRRQTPLTLRRWTRREYDRLVDAGMLAHEPLELLGGQLVIAEPQGSYHASALGLIGDALRGAFGPGWLVRVQMPIALDDESEPEPDLAVVAGTWPAYRASHPARPALVVEVAESSLAFDREEKGSLYARAGIADYWIVDLVGRVIEVHRDPEPFPGSRHGWRYRTVTPRAAPAFIAPLAQPAARMAVGELLP